MPVPKLVATAVLMAANMAMSALRTTEGPRLTDTKATVADYGTPCNSFIGTRLVPAHCIFTKPIVEKKKKRKGKAGKQVTYTGYCSFFVQIADHPIGGVLQIYLDNHLVYDLTGSGERIYPIADDYELEAHMRFLLGGETQEPDPDMLAYIEARDGPGTCPAYRHCSGIYFENLPLENFGNRRPDVKVLASHGEPMLLPGDPSDITLVGVQSLTTTNGASVGPIPFALAGGLAVQPAAGDLVLIAISSVATNSDGGADVTPGVPGYSQVFAPVELPGSLTNPKIGLGVYYKVMGAVPDTTWSAAGSGASGSRGTAYEVVVLRGVDPADVLAGPGETVAVGGTVLNPPDIDIDGVPFDPGTLATSSFARRYVGASWAVRSLAGTSLPMMAGGAYPDDNFLIGELTAVHQVSSGGSASTSAGIAYGTPMYAGQPSTLAQLLSRVAERAGLEPDEYDFSQATQELPGYNWTQGTGRQICEHLCDLFDVDLRPHDFLLEALPRGSVSQGAIASAQFVAGDALPYKLLPEPDQDLPRRVFLTYADLTGGHEPNTAMPVGGPDRGASGSAEELSIDMSTLALTPDVAQQLIERRQRRLRFGRTSAEFALPRRQATLEPGDVWTPDFDGEAMIMRLKKLTIGADGVIATEWERDDPRIAVLPASAGAPMQGFIPPAVPTSVESVGDVLDVPMLIDAHDQSAPFAYLVAGPEEPGSWLGADYAMSETGELDSYLEQWDGIGSGDGAVIGVCAGALPTALPWLPDLGSALTVTLNQGELIAATLDELLTDPTRNLAAVRSGDSWELLQFMTPTLTGAYQYTIRGFLRGVRGTEHAIAGHAGGDRFVLLDGTAKRRTMGAGEIGDTDWYVVNTTGQAVDQTAAFSLAYTGASHRPYAAVHPVVEQAGADWLFAATRRTRIGGATLDGQDVPLGEASESWSLDIMDGLAVKRTIAGTSLPLTYTEADQITDWGAPLGAAPDAVLYQVNPTLSLRGFPLAMAA